VDESLQPLQDNVLARLATMETRDLLPGETLTIDTEPLRLAPGWYRLQAGDGTATVATSLVVIE
jgi:hypothetical protein